MTEKGHKRNFQGNGCVSYLECAGNNTSIYTCQNGNCTLNTVHCIDYKSYLIKLIFLIALRSINKCNVEHENLNMDWMFGGRGIGDGF